MYVHAQASDVTVLRILSRLGVVLVVAGFRVIVHLRHDYVVGDAERAQANFNLEALWKFLILGVLVRAVEFVLRQRHYVFVCGTLLGAYALNDARVDLHPESRRQRSPSQTKL